MKKILFIILDYSKVVIIAFVIATLISTQLFTFSKVQQRSMQNTLIHGDTILIEKISLKFNALKKGQIVVLLDEKNVDSSFWGKVVRLYKDMYGKFTRKTNENRLVKRVIALPGDEIDIFDGKVFLNGEELIEEYAATKTYPRNFELPYTVKEGEVFVLGDNREVSKDSREFGPIKNEQIEGIAVFRIFPLNKIGNLF